MSLMMDLRARGKFQMMETKMTVEEPDRVGGDISGVAGVDWLGMELSRRETDREAEHTR